MTELAKDYGLDEVAEALGMSTRWVRDQCKNNGAVHNRYGNKIRFTAEQVEQLRAMHTKAPVPESLTTGRKRRSS
jgi:predicted DNA-binding protein YlxM (UPF0122 family)